MIHPAPIGVELAAKAGRMLLGSTAPASEVVEIMLRICEATGVRGVIADVTYNQIVITWEQSDSVRTQVDAIKSRAFDYGRYTDASRIVHRFLGGAIGAEEALAALDATAAGPSRFPAWLSRITAGLSGVAIALLFGAGAVAAAFAFLANVLIDLLYGFLGRRNWPSFFIQVLVGILAVVVAACVHAMSPGADSSAVVVAVIMMMLAGMTSTGAVQDLMTGWHLTGLGRLTEGIMNTIGLIVGIRVAILTLDALGLRMIVGPDVAIGAYPLWLMCLISGGIAVAFSLYCNLPPGMFAPAACLTAFGWVSFTVASNLGLSTVWASAAAALVGGAVAAPLSSWLKVPSAILCAIAIIPLFPGLTLYQGLLEGVDNGGELVLRAAATAAALAGGMMFGQYCAGRLMSATTVGKRLFAPHFRVPFTTKRDLDELPG